jgi:hypothetical protein
MSLCNHYEHFKGTVREELNARAAIDGIPPMPGWDGDVGVVTFDDAATWLGLDPERGARSWRVRVGGCAALPPFGDA